MIIVLEGADFSQNNLGQVEITTILDPFTKAAILASGNNSLTDEQKASLNTFFRRLGAFGGTGTIWNKLSYLWVPMIAGDLAHTLVNYKDNIASAIPDSSIWSLQEKGIKAFGNPQNGIVISGSDLSNNDFSMFCIASSITPMITIGSTNPGMFGMRTVINSLHTNINLSVHKDDGSEVITMPFAENYTTEDFNKLVGLSVYGSESNNAFVYESDGVVEKTLGLPASNFDSNIIIGRDVTAVTNSTKGSIRFLAAGSHLTFDEMTQMKLACETLLEAFI